MNHEGYVLPGEWCVVLPGRVLRDPHMPYLPCDCTLSELLRPVNAKSGDGQEEFIGGNGHAGDCTE